MANPKTLPKVLLLAYVTLTFAVGADAATFEVRNECQDPVWAASFASRDPPSGKRLGQGESWTVTARPGTSSGRIWGRTNCTFDPSGYGTCETGDCDGLLECSSRGRAPNTMVEYTIGGFGNRDFFDVSLVDGFNLPIEFSSSPQCNQVIRCAGNIIGECPNELRMNSSCNGPCSVFKTEEYCCTNAGKCEPTDLSRFFKDRCSYAFTYPMDDATATFSCATGTNYTVIFCP